MGTPAAPRNAASPASKVASLILRMFTFGILVVSLIILCTNKESKKQRVKLLYTYYEIEFYKIEFIDVKAFRNMLATIVVGIAYFLMQVGLSIYNVVKKSVGFILLDFYGDKLISYVLATGAAAGLGVTVDGKKCLDDRGLKLSTFYDKAYASESLLLIAFLCTALLSVLSSHALIPRTA